MDLKYQPKTHELLAHDQKSMGFFCGPRLIRQLHHPAHYKNQSTLLPIQLGIEKWYVPVDGNVNGNLSLLKDASDYVSTLYDVVGGATELNQELGAAQPKWDKDIGLLFDGVNDLFESSDPFFDLSGSFTICAWVNFDFLNSTEPIFNKWEQTGNQRAFLMQKRASNRIAFSLSHDGVTGTLVETSISYPNNTWHFAAFVYDEVNQKIKVSVNGGPFYQATHSSGVFSSNSNFKVGYTPTGTFMDGSIGSFYLKREAMTIEDITQLYNLGNLYKG